MFQMRLLHVLFCTMYLRNVFGRDILYEVMNQGAVEHRRRYLNSNNVEQVGERIRMILKNYVNKIQISGRPHII